MKASGITALPERTLHERAWSLRFINDRHNPQSLEEINSLGPVRDDMERLLGWVECLVSGRYSDRVDHGEKTDESLALEITQKVVSELPKEVFVDTRTFGAAAHKEIRKLFDIDERPLWDEVDERIHGTPGDAPILEKSVAWQGLDALKPWVGWLGAFEANVKEAQA